MNRNTAFSRKIIYVGAIALLLFPLFRLGQPGSGWLAGLRKEYGLAQAQLGEIDTTSETMKLVTLGMRGVAANQLWLRANEYSKKEDWDNLRVTLNQIRTLQPNFIKVWEFQAHNLSYNVSVEFDDYRYRYHWVKKGIDFLIEGTHYNTNEPALLRWTGWFMSHKIGRSDERVEFRELFRNDRDYHAELRKDVPIEGREAEGPDGKPDNWLLGRLWYGMAQDAAASGRSLRGRTPLVFYADAPMARIYYAQAIEDEGWLDERAELAWQIGLEEWLQFGQREIPTTWGHNIRLSMLKELVDQRNELRDKLEALAPGLREQLRAQREAELTDEERQALALPFPSRTDRMHLAYASAQQKINVTDKDVVDNLPPDLKIAAGALSAKFIETQLTLEHCDRYRGIVNYGYWEMRCEAEQLPDAVAARKHVYQALERLKKTDLVAAKNEFELAWDKWAIVFNQYPALMEDITGEALNDSIDKYEHVLLQMGLAGLPPDFVLKELRSRKPTSMPEFNSARRPGGPPTMPSSINVDVREIPVPGQPSPQGPQQP